MRRHHPDSPIVVLSASEEQETALRTIQSGGQDYLSKVRFTPEALGGVIRYAYERHRFEKGVASK